MPLFTKGKYFSIFSDILMNIKSILKKENDSKIKLFFQDKLENVTDNNNKNKNSIKLNCKRYIEKIENSILKNTIYKGIKLSEIEYLYLKNLAIKYKKKIDMLSKLIKQKKETILNIYLQICQKKIIEINKENKKNFPILLKNLSPRQSLLLNKNEKKKEIKNSSSEEKEKKNIYIGTFNMEKFLNKEQIIELQKGEFVNGYIFKNKFDENKGKPYIFRENNIKKKKHRPSIIHGSPEYYLEKGKINVNRFSTISIDKCSVPLFLIKKKKLNKHKKNALSSPEFNFEEKKNIEYQTINHHKSRNNVIINNCFTENYFPKVNLISRNNSKNSRNKIRLKSYLSKEDFFY